MDKNLRIRGQFVSAVLRETAEMIQDRQMRVVKEWSLFDSRAMENQIKGHFSVNDAAGGGSLTMRYLTYTRFLDMRDPRRSVKREGYHLYNRIVFGVLYNPTINTLQWGLTEDVKQVIHKEMESIYKTNMPYYKVRDVALKQVAASDRNLAAMLSKSIRTGYH